jgi:hypothetical protein
MTRLPRTGRATLFADGVLIPAQTLQEALVIDSAMLSLAIAVCILCEGARSAAIPADLTLSQAMRMALSSSTQLRTA